MEFHFYFCLVLPFYTLLQYYTHILYEVPIAHHGYLGKVVNLFRMVDFLRNMFEICSKCAYSVFKANHMKHFNQLMGLSVRTGCASVWLCEIVYLPYVLPTMDACGCSKI